MAGDWRPCDQCGGACVGGETSCLAHVGAKEHAAVLGQFSESGELDVRGVTISDALFGEIFDAAPHDTDGYRTFSAAMFDRVFRVALGEHVGVAVGGHDG